METTDQSIDATTKAQLDEPITFTGVNYRNTCERLLQEQKWLLWQLSSPKDQPIMGDSLGNPENLENIAQPEDSSTGRRVSVLGSSAGLSLY